jgi:asparagine synthetase B (glutamine-hydrolysing)
MHLNKPVKRLHSQNKFFEGDEQPDAKGNFLGGLNSSDRKRQVEDMSTPDRTKHHQEGSRAFVRKLPKYVSLNCIVNEPNTNSEGACSGSGGIDSSLIATGITNDNRKSPKIVPLSLVLKKVKRRHAVKLCKTESTHLYEEKSSDCSVNSSDYSIYKYSVDDENCSPQAEYELQDSKRSRYSSNDLRSHVAHHKRTSGGMVREHSFQLV